ncbi:cyclin-D5-1-like [Bidens hawaiensis]|uniref:cyclin-D5-1-like n=1 Tax=Bidens hawaiensis TaxID=980011 RepID=UPI0040492F29
MAGSSSLSKFLSLPKPTRLPDDEDDELNQYSKLSLIENEECLMTLLEKETAGNCIDSHADEWIKTARSEAIQWIFNTRSVLQFQFRTAYLSITYVDRFISKSPIIVSHDKKPWLIRLLAIACLSMAAKMNESKNWALSSLLQTEPFTENVVKRMEIMVLNELEWRIHSITPFHFISYFVSFLFKEIASSSSETERRLMYLISQIICAATNDMELMAHWASTIAMAATLMAMDEGLSRESMEMKVKTTWVNQLFDHVDVYTCYSRMLELEPLKVNLTEPDCSNNEKNPPKSQKIS